MISFYFIYQSIKSDFYLFWGVPLLFSFAKIQKENLLSARKPQKQNSGTFDINWNCGQQEKKYDEIQYKIFSVNIND